VRDYDSETFGTMWNDQFDMDPVPWGADPGDTAEAVSFLGEISQGGPVLELGVGPGRIALPLAQGVEVHGIDISDKMLDRLAAASEAAGGGVVLHKGDFAEVETGYGASHFSLVYCAFDTFCMLLSLEEQRRCITNCARALKPGGRLVLQTTPPDPDLYAQPASVMPFELGVDRVQLIAGHWDAARQIHSIVFLMVVDGGLKTYPVKLRYSWVTELDLIAELAGLELEFRSNEWEQRRTDVTQGRIVSTWRKT
jgi:SAM-dependent methyltransferase